MLQTVVQSISPYQNILMNYFFGAEIDEIDSPLKSPNPRKARFRGLGTNSKTVSFRAVFHRIGLISKSDHFGWPVINQWDC